MKIWLDGHLSGRTAKWIGENFAAEADTFHRLGLGAVDDSEAFWEARTAGAAVMTKDRDFAELLSLHGPPPKVILLTCGNTSDANLRAALLRVHFAGALELLGSGEPLVEIG